MMLKRFGRTGFFCALLLWAWPTFAQDQSFADSLEAAIASAPPDSNRVKMLNDLAWELKFDDPDAARNYLSVSLALARQIGFPSGIGDAYNYRGVVEDIHGNPELAIDYFERARIIRDSLGDQRGVASLYNNIGNVNENLGDFTAALDSYFSSLRIREDLKDTARMMRLYYNISIVQENMGNYPEAQGYLLDYLELVGLTNNTQNLGNAYNVLGNVSTEMDRPEEALSYYQQALDFHQTAENAWEESSVLNNMGNLLLTEAEATWAEGEDANWEGFDQEGPLNQTNESTELYGQALSIRLQLGDSDGQAEVYNNIALTHKFRGSILRDIGKSAEAETEWRKALGYLDKALAIWEPANNKQGILELYNGYGDINRRQGNFSVAEEYVSQRLILAEEIGDQKAIQSAYKDLSRLYAAKGNYEKAYDFRKQYDEIRYKRMDEKREKDIERRYAIYGDQKIQRQIEKQENELELQDAELRQARIRQYSLVGGALGLMLLVFLMVNRNRIKTKANKDLKEKNEIIDQERRRSDELLLNILPASTAEELKTKGKAKAKRYESVSVLFTDFKSFTTIAETLSPEELVDMLDECFRAFDEITSRYGIEKIKTIGDSYMCAAGLPTESEDHATLIVRASLDIQGFMSSYKDRQLKAGKPAFEARVGIHSGAVVAGVVGNKKFAYDIWGDTVNLAARMEASGQPGKINISEDTYKLLNGEFVCKSRGRIAAKNKGDQLMYFVEGRKIGFNYEALEQEVMPMLERKLDSQLSYHGVHHTREVIECAEELGLLEGIHPADRLLIRSAALLHDSGFIEQANGHEEISCRIAKEILPHHGYASDEIESICGMIMATKIPQTPKNHLEAILCDADLDYLGRSDYDEIAGTLGKEMAWLYNLTSERKWMEIQISFLEQHSYHTRTNKVRRASGKAQQLAKIRAELSNGEALR